jgi:hypothetical protein
MPTRFSRPNASRVIGRKVLIACEGTKTEYLYFQAIRSSLRLPTLQVVVVRPDGTDPLNVVRKAVVEKRRLKKDLAWVTNDQAWAVFDGDEHRDSNRANWNDAIQLAASNDIKLAISNPCFELWYILHFQDCERALNRVDALRLLRKHIKEYAKGIVPWPNPLQPLTSTAIQRAQFLAAKYERDGFDPYYNPSSGISRLVETLLALGKERS